MSRRMESWPWITGRHGKVIGGRKAGRELEVATGGSKGDNREKSKTDGKTGSWRELSGDE
ncbi:hypothetical protein BC835DRAFT_1346742 [Cytidiella melzeri]|nr:hypothetical protein BC835DRAFT_1346742 [Cytidiella melzeri]